MLVAALAALVADLLARPETSQTSDPASQPVELVTPVVSWLEITPPPSGDTAAIPSAEPCTAPAGWSTYQVESGDTLFVLAQRFGTDIQELKRVNCLETATIFAGQSLFVPWQEGLPAPEPAGSTATTGSSASADGSVIPDRYLHIVLLGTDIRPNKPATTWRTDSIIVVSVDVEDHSVRMLHIPRDLWVYIPGHDYGRINTAEMLGEFDKAGSGPLLVKNTIYYNLGIPVHYYVQVDFKTFPEIIDSLGGLDVDVACPVPEIGLTQTGMLHMDGKMVLGYARRRDTSSDFDRGIRQRQVLMALKEQALTPGTLLKLPKLWSALKDDYKTDIPFDKVIELASIGMGVDTRNIVSKGISGVYVKDWVAPDGEMVLLPRENKIRELLQSVYAPLQSDRVRAAPKARVHILNGSQHPQADQLAAAALRRTGFAISGTGSANSQQVAKTQIIVYKGDPARGDRLADELGVPLSALQDYTAIPEPPDFSNPVDIKVILGQDYDPCWR